MQKKIKNSNNLVDWLTGWLVDWVYWVCLQPQAKRSSNGHRPFRTSHLLNFFFVLCPSSIVHRPSPFGPPTSDLRPPSSSPFSPSELHNFTTSLLLPLTFILSPFTFRLSPSSLVPRPSSLEFSVWVLIKNWKLKIHNCEFSLLTFWTSQLLNFFFVLWSSSIIPRPQFFQLPSFYPLTFLVILWQNIYIASRNQNYYVELKSWPNEIKTI